MVHTAGVKGRRASLDPVNHVILTEEKLGQIGAVLARNSGN
jgi:hypothetical protein